MIASCSAGVTTMDPGGGFSFEYYYPSYSPDKPDPYPPSRMSLSNYSGCCEINYVNKNIHCIVEAKFEQFVEGSAVMLRDHFE